MKLIFFLIITMSSYISFSQEKGTIEVKKNNNDSIEEIDIEPFFIDYDVLPQFPGERLSYMSLCPKILTTLIQQKSKDNQVQYIFSFLLRMMVK